MSLYKTFVKNWLRDFPWYTILFHTHLWSLVINILKWFWGFWLLLLFLNFRAMGCHRFHQLFNVFTGILQNDDASNGQLLNRARNEEAQAPLIFPECSRILSAYLLNGTSRLLERFIKNWDGTTLSLMTVRKPGHLCLCDATLVT